MFEQLEYEQTSIYDFLQEEKSQELPPSELVAQVDEAQVAVQAPKSDLDAFKSPSCPICFELEWKCTHEIFKPTEDTDSNATHMETLFSVGDVLTVRQASNVYNSDKQPEDFYYIEDYEGEQVKLLNIRGDLLLCNTFNLDRNIWLRAHEVIKM